MTRLRLLPSVALAALFMFSMQPAKAVEILIHYIKQDVERPPTLTEMDVLPDDLGQAGARLGLSDNATTGGFLGHEYKLSFTSVSSEGDWDAALQTALAKGDLVLVDAPVQSLLAAADSAGADKLIFNVSSEDVSLREAECRANVLHTLPSRAMKADALMQYLRWKQWEDLALITGPHAGDKAFGAALEAAAVKFGMKIDSSADWTIDSDLRRSAQTEVAQFTQQLGDFDVLVVADELRDFGRYMLYNTWKPRPVVGSEGLVPSAWSPVVEQWGALQLQNRFIETAGRRMQDVDYAAWAAVRSIGEAVTRTGAADARTVRSYLLGDDFELAGFKGAPLTFRNWNGQLRQPIVLAHPRALAAQAPLDGFLHQTDPLDTLGIDAPESKCEDFKQ